MKELNEMNHAELQQYALDAIEKGVAEWKEIRGQYGLDAVVFIDDYNRALHRHGFGKSVELLCPRSFERACIFGPDSLRDVVEFDGAQGHVKLHPKRLIDFIDSEIAGAEASMRYLRNHLESNA
jgi:hypothetical protein